MIVHFFFRQTNLYIKRMYLFTKRIKSPIGDIIGLASEKGICLLDFADKNSVSGEIAKLERYTGCTQIKEGNLHLKNLEKELGLYFRKELKTFSVPLDMIGTDFQQKVWEALLEIPYGKTISYLQQATSIDNTKAVRAVANANSRNKISILIPCHRVIGSNGKLTGYAGGIDRKRFLIDLEDGNQLNFI